MSHWHAVPTPSTRLDSPVDCHAAAGAPRTSSTKAQAAPTKGEAPRARADGRQVRQAARAGTIERRGQAGELGPGPRRVGRHRPELVLLQYYRCPYPRPIITHTRRRRQEEEAERHPEASRKGSVRCDVGLRQGRVGRRERQTEASGSKKAGAEEERCGSSHDGREGRGLARDCPIGRESHPEEGTTGGGEYIGRAGGVPRCEESGGQRSL
mmetsp:Transcript_21022/g.64754  ORF Transcript_21022/g.64754 Transcript_21022/m.64754 type:complete len:211 (+) Transcript_21022:909-1541(+)